MAILSAKTFGTGVRVTAPLLEQFITALLPAYQTIPPVLRNAEEVATTLVFVNYCTIGTAFYYTTEISDYTAYFISTLNEPESTDTLYN